MVENLSYYDTIRLVPNTFSGAEEYARELGFGTLDAFYAYIRGKRIGDLGSGYDGLAFSVYLDQAFYPDLIHSTEIFSINPKRYEPEHHSERLRYALQYAAARVPGISADQVVSVLQQVDAHACADVGHHLATFSNRTFDAMFENHAISFHLDVYPNPLQVLEGTLIECMRKIKPLGS